MRCFPFTGSWNLWIQNLWIQKDPLCSLSFSEAWNNPHFKSNIPTKSPKSTQANTPLKHLFKIDVGVFKDNEIFLL